MWRHSENCQKAFRTMKEVTADETEHYITNMAQEAGQQRLESGSADHKNSAEKRCVSA